MSHQSRDWLSHHPCASVLSALICPLQGGQGGGEESRKTSAEAGNRKLCALKEAAKVQARAEKQEKEEQLEQE